MTRSLLSLVHGKIVDSNDDVVVLDMKELSAERFRFWCGLTLAISSCFFIGASFIVKKKALQRLNATGGVRAGSGGYGYLTDWLWWSGLLSSNAFRS